MADKLKRGHICVQWEITDRFEPRDTGILVLVKNKHGYYCWAESDMRTAHIFATPEEALDTLVWTEKEGVVLPYVGPRWDGQDD